MAMVAAVLMKESQMLDVVLMVLITPIKRMRSEL
jgi:hypothetical protein